MKEEDERQTTTTTKNGETWKESCAWCTRNVPASSLNHCECFVCRLCVCINSNASHRGLSLSSLGCSSFSTFSSISIQAISSASRSFRTVNSLAIACNIDDLCCCRPLLLLLLDKEFVTIFFLFVYWQNSKKLMMQDVNAHCQHVCVCTSVACIFYNSHSFDAFTHSAGVVVLVVVVAILYSRTMAYLFIIVQRANGCVNDSQFQYTLVLLLYISSDDDTQRQRKRAKCRMHVGSIKCTVTLLLPTIHCHSRCSIYMYKDWDFQYAKRRNLCLGAIDRSRSPDAQFP